MKTLYGLTEQQMWEVARECRLENWRSLVTSLNDDDDRLNLTDDDIEKVLVEVDTLWDRSERVNELEVDMTYKAIKFATGK